MGFVMMKRGVGDHDAERALPEEISAVYGWRSESAWAKECGKRDHYFLRVLWEPRHGAH